MTEPAFVYDPELDGDADPGEVVWTWVPFEEDATKGKDRPAVVIARDGADVLIVPLSSKDHSHRPDHDDWVPLGSGAWDADGRTSYADLGRVLTVKADSIRREGAVLERARFEALARAVENGRGRSSHQ